MNSLFVNNIPTSKEKIIPYRSELKSHDLNEIQKDTLSDILDLFNKSNELQKQMNQMWLMQSINRMSTEHQIHELKNQASLLLEENKNLTRGETEERTVTAYADQVFYETDPMYQAAYNKQADCLTSKTVSSTSRIRLYDPIYNETYLPASFMAMIGPDSFRVGGSIYAIEDTDIAYAFNGDLKTAWVRKVETGPSIKEIVNEIVIALPEDMLTSRLVNEIYIHPFPEYSMDILDIQYRVNGGWESIPGLFQYKNATTESVTDVFGNTSDVPVLASCGTMLFNFPEISVNQIKLILRQKTYMENLNTGDRIFYLGIHDMDIRYNQYTRNYSEFCLPFTIKETESDVLLTKLTLLSNNGTVLEDGIKTELYFYDSQGNAHRMTESFPIKTKEKRFKIRFKLGNSQVTPNLYGAVLSYKKS